MMLDGISYTAWSIAKTQVMSGLIPRVHGRWEWDYIVMSNTGTNVGSGTEISCSVPAWGTGSTPGASHKDCLAVQSPRYHSQQTPPGQGHDLWLMWSHVVVGIKQVR